MKHFQFAIASIVDANTGFGLTRGGGNIDYRDAEIRSRAIRSKSVQAFFGAIRAAVRDTLAAYREKARQRRAIEELSLLNDHYLDDIGLTRGDITAVKLGQTSLEVLDADRRSRLAVAPLDFVDTGRIDDLTREAEAVNEAEYGAAKRA
ncbi:MAG: DUF1127 domain-containing protein [Gammaproteobacteria bacterium]|jgi:uncharacterized protein YjiS (DUF1127 family)